jgi:hypothetical protein
MKYINTLVLKRYRAARIFFDKSENKVSPYFSYKELLVKMKRDIRYKTLDWDVFECNCFTDY